MWKIISFSSQVLVTMIVQIPLDSVGALDDNVIRIDSSGRPIFRNILWLIWVVNLFDLEPEIIPIDPMHGLLYKFVFQILYFNCLKVENPS